jgi:DNA-binding NarL/FixJ family response regulator
MQHGSIRVVIVDDHQMVRETWKMILQKDERIDIIGECSSGVEAMEAAASLQPDVMLMDINMAPMNGFEATRRISKDHPQVKIIGVSINNQPSYARNMLHLGAKGYVTKNSPKDEMIKAIVAVCNGETFVCREVQEKMVEE